ncbi:hypothetical protein AYI68_g3078 [Smittium mucronatum]|uniref:Uncharacterized protein n=1 Tax=Smittium mucronatum TaxID=133383 RepID=A0A1R0H0Y6_9FUNG|nr:hypothetical protein AYI68_g3078 [Smittium mucronatum]
MESNQKYDNTFPEMVHGHADVDFRKNQEAEIENGAYSCKSAFIPNVGWCLSKKQNSQRDPDRYLFTMLFTDGTKLEVDSGSDNVQYSEYSYGEKNKNLNSLKEYKIDPSIPQAVKEKLQQLPHFLCLVGIENL